jgi:ribosomal protein S1
VKNFITIIVSILFTFAISSIPFAIGEEKAVPTTLPAPSKLPYASKVQQITGGVSAVNTTTNSITVTKKIRDKVVEAVVTIDAKTEIMKEKKNKSFSDIKMGDKVVVKYTKVDGKNIAKSITIKPAEPESKEKQIEKKAKPAKKK